jgi:hypothetical protein
MRKALPLLCLVFACGKQTFLAAAFVNVPPFPNPQSQSTPFPGYTELAAYFGTVDTTDITSLDASKVQPITDATANVSWYDQNDTTKPVNLYTSSTPAAQNKWKQSSGTYTLTSTDEAQLKFEVAVPYTLVLQTKDGDAYGASFVPGPEDDLVQFASAAAHCDAFSYSVPRCLFGHAANQPLTVDRVNTTNVDPAFILVGRVDPNNPTAQPSITYQTLPTDAVSLLKYELSDVPYRVTSWSIPGSAFPSTGIYVVVLLTAKNGKVSGNAFIGSTAVVGTGKPGLVVVE